MSGPVPSPQALIAALPIAMVVLDADGCIASANAAAETMLNASAAHLKHKPLGIVLRLPDACRAGLRGDGVFTAYDQSVTTARDVKINVDFHATPLIDLDGWRLVSLHPGAMQQPMGDRKSTSRAASAIAAMLAHEIKNPLSGIRGAAQLLETGATPEAKAMTDLIRDEVDRIARLIDRMEHFTDARTVDRQPENIYPIIHHARVLAEAGFGPGVTINDAFDPSLPPALVHADSMVQILLNLMKNAAEAAGRNPATITLTTRYRHGVAVPVADGKRLSVPIELCVIDDGPGPPPDLADHLFEPFVSSKAAGRGLGLALVDKLVRDNGGIVHFTREGEPERTVFRILLPRAA